MKKIKAIFFDMDGTLLPMDQDDFVKAYFGAITKKIAPLGYSPEKLINGLLKGTAAMAKNDGAITNEQLFWNVFAAELGERILNEMPVFDDFYLHEFDAVKAVCGYNAKAATTVKALRDEGYRLILASNPFFPITAQKKRMTWAGVDPDDFDYITSYENSRYCKPNIKYYEEILSSIGLRSDECIMVGNDVDEDMIARKAGFKVYLLTGCVINRRQADINEFPNGDFDDLLRYVANL